MTQTLNWILAKLVGWEQDFLLVLGLKSWISISRVWALNHFVQHHLKLINIELCFEITKLMCKMLKIE